MTNYEVRRYNKLTLHSLFGSGFFSWAIIVGKTCSQKYGWFRYEHFDIFDYLETQGGVMWVCFRDGKPVGVMLARLYFSIFDSRTKILCQDLLYAEDGAKRAAYFLMREFIDFGKVNANHIYTMTAKHANIKGSSLERLGFVKSEESYLLEVDRGRQGCKE